MTNNENQTDHGVKLEPLVIRFFDEEFMLARVDDVWYLISKKWNSIIGEGKTVDETLTSILESIEIAKKNYCTAPDEGLTEDGIELKRWLTKIVLVKKSV